MSKGVGTDLVCAQICAEICTGEERHRGAIVRIGGSGYNDISNGGNGNRFGEEVRVLRHLPLKNPKPDCGEFIDIILGKRSAKRVPPVEYIVSEAVMKPVVTELLGREWVAVGEDRASYEAYLDNFIAFWRHMGYDFVRLELGLPFQVRRTAAKDTAPGVEGQLHWADEHTGAIMTWEDFERYRWPSPTDTDLFALEYITTHMPEGMGLMTCHGGGIFEHVSSIMSLEGMCLALCEQPDLVAAVANKAGEALAAYYERLVGLDHVIALFQGDDMGFRTQTLVPPDALRTHCLPWLKRFAQTAHTHGLPFFLHSCGQVDAIMEDLIEDVGIDAKHSFEDVIVPVQDFQVKYGKRIGVLGGVDINRLTCDTPEEVRRHTRFLMETCGARGRYAIGSGNSIPSYIPVGNFLAMLDEVADFTN